MQRKSLPHCKPPPPHTASKSNTLHAAEHTPQRFAATVNTRPPSRLLAHSLLAPAGIPMRQFSHRFNQRRESGIGVIKDVEEEKREEEEEEEDI
ncbi:hypothetical protein E2C01_092227 [Portunus trituberculatus]|uniref:Uncharacterized protein n=1 Tax=Portunus trituberculatus TaxID=210409 RepID=A0A5B7JQU3_PORTR|nr:hypothetical protein [Portunus trituberculatus]